MTRLLLFLLLAASPLLPASDSDYLAQLPTGERWLGHLRDDLLPFWIVPTALGEPIGAFPSTRCDDWSALDFRNPCVPIRGNSYLLTPSRYLVTLSRQIYGYGVAYHLTGDPQYLDWMKAGLAYLRQRMIDPAGGMYLSEDLNTRALGPVREFRDPQQLGYGLLGLGFYYYLTRDDSVLPDILAAKKYLLDNYYNPQLGAMQWLLRNNGTTRADFKRLVSNLDQMNTYMVLLAPILPEPYQTEWKQSLTLLSRSMIGVYYVPEQNLLFTSADTARDTNVAFTGVDYGHTSKALWMMRFTGQLTGDKTLIQFAEPAARRHLDRSFVAEDGSWAQGVLPGGATDKNKNWWVFAELDQLSNTLALNDVTAGKYLPQTADYWFKYFVDHEFGEVWNGVDFGTNAPQKSSPKAWQWKSAYHSFEHVLVGYLGAQWLHSQPATLHYAFVKPVPQSDIRPYYFTAPVLSVAARQVNGVSYQAVRFDIPAKVETPLLAAPDSIVSIYGTKLATATAAAANADLPTTLAGTTATIKDSTGATLPAKLYFASPTQVNLVVPATAKTGTASISISASDGTATTRTLDIAKTAPSNFILDASTWLAAANVIRVDSNAAQSFEPVTQDLDVTNGAAYLTLYATGVRNASTVTATINGLNVPVFFAGAQGAYPGLDQINIGPLPKSLAGWGRVNIVIAADNQTAAPVTVRIK